MLPASDILITCHLYSFVMGERHLISTFVLQAVKLYTPRNLKGGTRSLFDHCITLWAYAWQPFDNHACR